MTTSLWDPFEIRGSTLRNRLGMAPMCLYRSPDGNPTPWHVHHYRERSYGVGLTLVEATALAPATRVSPQDLVLDERSDPAAWHALASGITEAGSVPVLQLSHAGRKASRTRPWDGDLPIQLSDGGWEPLGPSAEPFGPAQLRPTPMSACQANAVPTLFADAAARAIELGFQGVELHAGHGRLLHSFYSPLSNPRDDEWGGSREARSRLLLETAERVRSRLPRTAILSVRMSCSDWVSGGWTVDDSVWLAKKLGAVGADIIDCTSGGIIQGVAIERAPGYQVEFARAVRDGAGIATAAVGEIHSLELASQVIANGHADVALLGRRLLLDPYYVGRASGRADLLPVHYRRGLNRIAHALVRQGTPEL